MEFSKARISDVAEIERRSVPPTKIADGSLYVGLEHINGDGSFEQVGPVANGDLSSNKFAFNRDHVLFGKLRPYLRKTARPDFEGVCSTDILPLRPKAGKLDRAYLYHALRDHNFIDLASLRATGVNLPRLSPKLLANLEIPLPPLEEQRRIAAILDKADALRAKRREAIAKLDQLLQSVFLEMFGDPVANPHGWERMSLGELISEGPQNGLYKPASDYGSGTPILRIDVFSSGDHIDFELPKRLRVTDDELNKYALTEHDVVINRVNSPEHLGKVALITRLKEPAVFESNMMRFAIDTTRAESEYVVEALRSRHAKQQIQRCRKDAINQSSINQGDVRSLEILVPPLDYLKRYKRVSAATRAMKQRSLAFLDKVELIFLALQQRAFGGQL